MKYFLIFLGGGIGALLRWQTSLITIGYHIPLGTFIANLLGAFLMGYFTVRLKHWHIKHPKLKQGLTTGFLGALTTFSTFQLELVTLAQQFDWLTLIIYGLSSYCGGLICCFFGYKLGGVHT
ncbi:fluoride efflux transporter CrcB [Staphylococcus intermedius]|uniref:fluoride efflux transporter CrcB n=1 Tax=Staphylococcus intermedius TaxID=1285 RepID=UPI000474E210|nr:fluoride efflux transporter CrcB [Staphylococcus intermedius]PCF64598.1 camphor resistance protein CrcB [Staphylococcus intermedius]PCF80208.1 camphor resistance protein CrcB [Staphylococcus intermedius]PCF81558.1 camphor resistance protein CrcB [Staphylococcus intermedius]PCF84318.1 camphor resistance protein CrcB [Staphylococcus intermedius]PCF86424.1 camphor resistance protein CrcB [Staphylococcus intermedius]